MASWPYDDDDALLAELGAALREPGAVPVEFAAAAREAFTWRTVDAELAIAELIFDSVVDPEPAGRTRSTGSARTLAFQAGAVAIEIEVTEAGITGQLRPPGAGQVSARTSAGPFDEAAVDPIGFFTLRLPPPGPVRLYARTGTFQVATSWVSLT